MSRQYCSMLNLVGLQSNQSVVISLRSPVERRRRNHDVITLLPPCWFRLRTKSTVARRTHIVVLFVVDAGVTLWRKPRRKYGRIRCVVWHTGVVGIECKSRLDSLTSALSTPTDRLTANDTARRNECRLVMLSSCRRRRGRRQSSRVRHDLVSGGRCRQYARVVGKHRVTFGCFTTRLSFAIFVSASCSPSAVLSPVHGSCYLWRGRRWRHRGDRQCGCPLVTASMRRSRRVEIVNDANLPGAD